MPSFRTESGDYMPDRIVMREGQLGIPTHIAKALYKKSYKQAFLSSEDGTLT